MRHSKGKNFQKRPQGGKPKFEKGFGRRGERSRSDVREDKPRTEKPRPEKPRTEKPKFEKREREVQSAFTRLQGPLLWGYHAVRAAWTNPKRRILRLLVTESALAGFQDTLNDSSLKRPQPEVIDKGAFERMMPPGAVHQGIAALVEPLPMRDAHDLVASLKEEEKATILILDQVTDPHNVGAILRSAAAFGAQGVIVQDRHAPEMNGVLAKTASGAADVIPVAAETNLSRAIEFLQENGFFVAGLDERGDAISDLPKHTRVALVLGAEGSGLRPNVANHCDQLVCLPTQGAIRSLNVSNAAAVALYALKVS